MKEFERWADDYEDWGYRGSAKGNAEKGWRGALKEVLEQANNLDCSDALKYRKIMEWIKEELSCE